MDVSPDAFCAVFGISTLLIFTVVPVIGIWSSYAAAIFAIVLFFAPVCFLVVVLIIVFGASLAAGVGSVILFIATLLGEIFRWLSLFLLGLPWLFFYLLWACTILLLNCPGFLLRCLNLLYTSIIFRSPPLCYFWQTWTLQPRRFGWKYLNERGESSNTLGADSYLESTNPKTSILCEDCSRVVEGSGLLSGSIYILTRRCEWHKWSTSIRGAELAPSRMFCHLCNILWYSVPKTTREDIANTVNNRRDVNDKPICLWIKLWESYDGRWYADYRRYLQLFSVEDSSDTHLELCDQLPLEQEPLQDSKSACAEIPPSTGSVIATNLAKEWIFDCLHRHKSTQCSNATIATNQFLPTRLLFVGDDTSSVLRLHERSLDYSSTTRTKYLALSHCWGVDCILPSQMLRLENKGNWKKDIDMRSLPRNFQDAITFTRQIGVSYLWIDSLCITQDDDKDWDAESKEMCNVYAHAWCTISSCGSANANGGCFHERNPLQQFPCNLLFSNKSAIVIRPKAEVGKEVYHAGSFALEVDQGPLSERAWAFQERLLSRRIIHFGATFLFFECNSHFASEMISGVTEYSEIARNAAATLQYEPVTSYRAAFNALQCSKLDLTSRERLELHKHWFKLVSLYTKAKLSKRTDRMIAIFGIAQSIRGNNNGLEYLSGLWRRHLLLDLLWCLEVGPGKRLTELHAPSWSWGAVDGEIGQRLIPFTAVNKDKEYDVVEVAVLEEPSTATTHSIGHIVRIPLNLQCRLLPVSNWTMINPDPQGGYVLGIQGKQRFMAHFAPDIENPGRCSELFCAEIVRVNVYDRRIIRKLHSIWSEGIVLRRNRGTQLIYERVGRFSARWPLPGCEDCCACFNFTYPMSTFDFRAVFDDRKPMESICIL